MRADRGGLSCRQRRKTSNEERDSGNKGVYVDGHRGWVKKW